MSLLCCESSAQFLASRCQLKCFTPGCHFNKSPLCIRTESLRRMISFCFEYKFDGHNLKATLIWCSLSIMSVFNSLSSFKTFLISNDGSSIPTAKVLAIDLICLTEPYSLSLTLGLFKGTCRETKDMCIDRFLLALFLSL